MQHFTQKNYLNLTYFQRHINIFSTPIQLRFSVPLTFESVQTSRKSPSTSATITYPVMSVGKLSRRTAFAAKSPYVWVLCHLQYVQRFLIQQGVLVPDEVKCCISHLKDTHFRTWHNTTREN